MEEKAYTLHKPLVIYFVSNEILTFIPQINSMDSENSIEIMCFKNILFIHNWNAAFVSIKKVNSH